MLGSVGVDGLADGSAPIISVPPSIITTCGVLLIGGSGMTTDGVCLPIIALFAPDLPRIGPP